jgi:hypothetical protein
VSEREGDGRRERGREREREKLGNFFTPYGTFSISLKRSKVLETFRIISQFQKLFMTMNFSISWQVHVMVNAY